MEYLPYILVALFFAPLIVIAAWIFHRYPLTNSALVSVITPHTTVPFRKNYALWGALLILTLIAITSGTPLVWLFILIGIAYAGFLRAMAYYLPLRAAVKANEVHRQ